MSFVVVLTGAAIGRSQNGATDCPHAVARFLSTSSRQSLDVLSRIDPESCWNVFGASNAKQKELDQKVQQGDRWAARYLAAHLKNLDGGTLEDSLIALGEFAERHMQDFLLLREQGLLSTREFSDSLTMLPLSTSDDPRAQLRSLESRRNKVLGVHRADLSKERSQALVCINNFVAEIRSKNPGVND